MTLGDHIEALDMTKAELARRLGVREQTIYNWINTGRVGSAAHRRNLAALCLPGILEREAIAELFPDNGYDPEIELMGWERFTDIPDSWWTQAIIDVERHVDILVGSGDGWFTNYGHRLGELIRAREDAGTTVHLRVLSADPDALAVQWRDTIESSQPGSTLTPGSLAGRVSNGLNIARGVVASVQSGELRTFRSDWWPGSVIYRFDSDMIVCGYLYGTRSIESWAVPLNEEDHPGTFAATLRSFEMLWTDSA